MAKDPKLRVEPFVKIMRDPLTKRKLFELLKKKRETIQKIVVKGKKIQYPRISDIFLEDEQGEEDPDEITAMMDSYEYDNDAQRLEHRRKGEQLKDGRNAGKERVESNTEEVDWSSDDETDSKEMDNNDGETSSSGKEMDTSDGELETNARDYKSHAGENEASRGRTWSRETGMEISDGDAETSDSDSEETNGTGSDCDGGSDDQSEDDDHSSDDSYSDVFC